MDHTRQGPGNPVGYGESLNPMTATDGELIAEFEGVSQVVADTLRFKAKLAIGEDAYTSLQATRVLGDVWQVGTAAAAGGAIASSGVVAGTFFGGWLTALGVATAVTPVGWVLGAAAASGAACYGVVRLFRGYEGSRVVKVPAFINTPIDFLGATLFDLMATLAIGVAREAGDLDEEERNGIRSYFIAEWGFDPDYLDAALPVIEQKAEDRGLEEIAKDLARFKLENPDCNFDAMKAELISFLTEIAEADGVIDAAEKAAIDRIDNIFEEAAGRTGETWTETITATPGRLWSRLSAAIQDSSATGKSEREKTEEDIAATIPENDLPLPVIWLLGKTGSGKTSLVRAITGVTEAAIGNGFEPCTPTASAYDFPPDEPLMRFLDTRGLGEAHYDPTEDLVMCQSGAHVLLILARLDDPVQGAIAKTLTRIKAKKPDMPVILLHTAGDRISDPAARERVKSVTQANLEKAWKAAIPSLELVLADPYAADLAPLCDHLLDILPSVALFMEHQVAADAETAAFLTNRNLVLRYAAAATVSGGVPVVGTASIPAVQIGMLASLAAEYDIEWDRTQIATFGAALGGGVLGGQALGLLGRQAASLVPVIGQIIVPVLSASWGFASTYALGRAAAYWMFQTSKGDKVDSQTLRARYAEAFSRTSRDATD